MAKVIPILILIAVIVGTFGIGFLVGYLTLKRRTVESESIDESESSSSYGNFTQNDDAKFRLILANEISADNLREHLKFLTMSSHMAGTPGDKDSADYVYKKFQSYGLDYVKYIDYDVFLSYPDEIKPNSVEFINATGAREEVKIVEPIYDPELNNTFIPRPFLGYAQAGSVTSDKVYFANYGTLEDFNYLASKGIVLNDSIVICRYGRIFRGNKVKLATKYGAKGVLIYDDPIRSAPKNTQTYPNGEFLPKEGTQRGTLYTGNGDPLTPFYPSTANGFRISENDSQELPTIPAQVISYELAERVLKMIEMNEPVADDDWKGALNVKYTFGGQLSNNQKLTLNVYNKRKRATTYNVVGLIRGTVEPDRFIIFGNHRDAWVLGALDASSGTSVLLETARALKKLQNFDGWRPKRTIVFMSWGAEEYGLIGSVEFVEEFTKKLSANAVAYLNVDVAVEGNHSFFATASPLLFDLLYDVTKHVKINDKLTVFDRWLEFVPNSDSTRPEISSVLGSGSDHMAFQQRVGVPCIDAAYMQNFYDPKYTLLGESYATYHSSYDTFRLVDKFIDPEFKTFKIMATILSELTRRLSDSVVLPFDAVEYANNMRTAFNNIKKTYGIELNDKNISLKGLENTINNYSVIAKQFHLKLNKLDRNQVNLVRQYNDQLKNLEKSFLDFSGIQRNGYLHMLSAPSLYNNYGGDGFPAFADALFNAVESSTSSNWKEVERQLAIVIYTIQSAITILTEPYSFDRYA